MQVSVKSFDVQMEVKRKGIEFEIHSPDGKKHLGDIVLKQTGFVWCKGRTKSANGIEVKFEKFIDWAENGATASKAKGKVAKKKNGK